MRACLDGLNVIFTSSILRGAAHAQSLRQALSPDQVGDSASNKVSEFAGIKERAAARGTLLVLNLRGPGRCLAHHATIAARASITVDLIIVLTDFRVAGIDNLGSVLAE